MKSCQLIRLLLAVGLCVLALQPAGGQTSGRRFNPQLSLARSAVLAGTPLPAGTYTVGTGGYFPTLDSAFSRLSGGGILGAVTLSLTDTFYVASGSKGGSFTLQGPISGAGPAARITIRPADNKAVTIQGNGLGTLFFKNVSYLTLDGVSLQGNTRLTVHALLDSVGKPWNDPVDIIGNSDFDIVQNLTFVSDDMRYESESVLLWADSLGSPDSCLVSGVAVKRATIGIYLAGGGTNYAVRPKGNVIRNNHIGSPTDSLIALGIQDEGADGTIIENNHVENLRLTVPWSGGPYQYGINTYFGKSPIIRNNIVHNLRATTAPSSRMGILASGDFGQRGSFVWIYNNMVYDLRAGTASPSSIELAGIRAWTQDYLYMDNNTVHLTGVPEGSPAINSAAVWLENSVASPTVRNNILVNTRNDPGCAALRIDAFPWGSNNNDLYVDPSGNGNVGRQSGSLFKLLSNWQINGSDQQSVSVFPAFRDLPYLHIDSTQASSKSLNGHGAPIAGILYDFDGQLRNAVTPDIGADEFSLNAAVVAQHFALTRDAHNPVMSGGASGAWNRHVFNPFVIFNTDSARFEMWFNATPGPPPGRPWSIGYAKSADGINWTMYPSAILSPDQGAWDASSVEGQVVIRDSGKYKMWYMGWNGATDPSSIGYATSTDGIHWTKYAPNPIMRHGTAAWEAGGPGYCMVMPVTGGYKMWYTGYDSSIKNPKIGYATSPDGIVWQRDTVNNPLLVSGAGGQWDDGGPGMPRVVQIGSVYYLWYTSNRVGENWYKSGGAYSIDGVTGWTKEASNPVLAPVPGAWDGNYTGIGSVLLIRDTLHFWYDGCKDPTNMNLLMIGHAYSPLVVGAVAEGGKGIPQEFVLLQNYPNPFNPTTTIDYQIPAAGVVTLRVYDLLGREVSTLVNERKTAGTYTVKFNATGLASGVYFYRIQVDRFVQSRKMLMLR